MDRSPEGGQRTEGVIALREFRPGDTRALVDALVAVREAGGTYPSPVTCGPGRGDIGDWLERSAARWRAVAEVDGTVVGHVQLVALSGDSSGLADWLHEHTTSEGGDLVELERLFVHPSWVGRGVGGALMGHAEQFSRTHSRSLVLWVLRSQHAAITLYRRRGWQHLGTCMTHPAGALEVFWLPREAAGPAAER